MGKLGRTRSYLAKNELHFFSQEKKELQDEGRTKESTWRMEKT